MKRDVDRVREDGADVKDIEECNLSRQIRVHLDICGRKKVIDKIRKSVGDRTEP